MRTAVPALALAGLLAAAGARAAAPVEALPPPRPPAVEQVAPGIGYQRLVRPGGQVVHVVRARRSPLTRLTPLLPGGAPVRRGALASAVAAGADGGLVAGLNGDFFSFSSNAPSGVLLAAGELVTAPEPSRSSLVLRPDGGIEALRLRLDGRYQPVDPTGAAALAARPFAAVNRPASRQGETVLFTPAYGALNTPAGASLREARIRLDEPGPLTPGVARSGTVIGVGAGGTVIGAGHWVLTGLGTASARIASELPLGRRVTISPALTGLPEGAVGAVGGGPLLVREGVPVLSAGEGFTGSQLTARTTRSAVAETAAGTVMLVTAEGPSQGSPGVTVAEQAGLLAALGARTAVAMDAGGSAQLVVGDRHVVRWPAPRALASAVGLSHAGVRLDPLPARISPNADRVDDAASAVVRAAAPGVARLTVARASGRPALRLWEGPLGPGSARVAVDPRRLGLADGIYVAVARHAPADGGPETEARRRVVVDRTLAALTARPSVRRSGRRVAGSVAVGFRLLRPARVTVRFRTPDGRPLRTLLSGRRLGAGRHGVRWDRRIRDRVITGRVEATVEARTRLGRTGLVREVTLRPLPRPRR